jgi:hypothetical protein|tara:strand:- start:1643 stop:2308 length:666 start_codon:yes stop_codon:yes gene_type:complete
MKIFKNIIDKNYIKKYSFEQLKRHKTLIYIESNKLNFNSHIKKLFHVLDKHDEETISTLEENYIIDFIGYTLDLFKDLIDNSYENIEVIKRYEKYNQMFINLIYICEMKFGVNFSLNKERKINYIYLSFYNDHYLKPTSYKRGLKNIGRLDNFKQKNDPKIYIKAENEFFRLTTVGFLFRFFPENREELIDVAQSNPGLMRPERPKKENPFEPKHKPRPKA